MQQLCKSCMTCFMFYCMFYFTCDRSLSDRPRVSNVDRQLTNRSRSFQVDLVTIKPCHGETSSFIRRRRLYYISLPPPQNIAIHRVRSFVGAFVSVSFVSSHLRSATPPKKPDDVSRTLCRLIVVYRCRCN